MRASRFVTRLWFPIRSKDHLGFCSFPLLFLFLSAESSISAQSLAASSPKSIIQFLFHFPSLHVSPTPSVILLFPPFHVVPTANLAVSFPCPKGENINKMFFLYFLCSGDKACTFILLSNTHRYLQSLRQTLAFLHCFP